jgi:drug/metabolite transporter superfamily protein YnfA
VEKVILVSLLVVATTLEAGGGAVVRIGLHHHAIGARIVLLFLGAIMLFCYGVVLNQAPFDFGRLIGAYVATFFSSSLGKSSTSLYSEPRPASPSF